MTKKEIMNVVKNIRNYLMSGNPIWDTDTVNEAMSTAIEALKERPKGEWIYCEDEYGTDGYRCSNCGRHIPWDYQHKFINFIDDYHTCPFCEARMKGADDENNRR